MNAKVNISKGEKQKLQSAIQFNELLSIHFSHKDLIGKDVLAFTKSQMKKMVKARKNGKGVTITMNRAQLKHQLKIEGGFLGALAGLAAKCLPTIAKTVLPTLGIDALTGLVSSMMQKAISNGLYLIPLMYVMVYHTLSRV